MKQILEVLTKNPDMAYTLYGMGKKLGIDEEALNRNSSVRASLSRCLNTMKKEGLVDSDYFNLRVPSDQISKTPKLSRRKYWFTKK